MIWTPSRIKNKTCQRVEELLVSQQPSISRAQLCMRTASCSWVTFLGVGGRICTPATVKPFSLQNTRKTQRNLKTHFVGVPPVQLPSVEQLTGWWDWGKSFGAPTL